ncbi:hypothetical protein [Mariniphaga sediminis]|uniref:hypothetical protein n=1 Tax=Mariniphaga sediminis TaxID=1628158 RepID=UPI0035680727
MHTESERHLLLIKQSLLEKQVKAQRQLDDLFSQEDAFTGHTDALNSIIDTATELIEAIDNELPGLKHVVPSTKEPSFLNLTMSKFLNMGWTTERNDFPVDLSCTLTVSSPPNYRSRTVSKIEFSFADLEGNNLVDVVALSVPLKITEGEPIKQF